MKIVLLAPHNVEAHYTASLLVRGFKAVTLPAGVPSLDFPKLMQDYLKHDGCLLISDDPNSVLYTYKQRENDMQPLEIAFFAQSQQPR
jgi:hypothetical protein